MYIHINPIRINRKMKQGKGEFMLHQICLISCLQPFGEQRALNITSVYKEELKVPVGTHNRRASQEAFYLEALCLC